MAEDLIKIENIDNFDCNKNTVIEASAGTGKTYTIKQIVPFLLKQKDENGYKYSLSNILMVTYTEKAAGELRSRIRNELIDVRKKLEAQGDDITEDLKGLKQRLDQEIEIIDDAPIFTIHSFCQKTLAENAIYSNCSQNMTLVDEKVGFDTFIGQYIRDKLATDKVFLYLHNNEPKDSRSKKKTFPVIVKDAINKYYLDANGDENDEIISLDVLSNEEKTQYDELTDKINTLNTIEDAKKREYIESNINTELEFIMRCFVIAHLKDIYMAWQKYKEDRNLQTYNDMIRVVHDSITEPESILLRELKKKYKYAIIDEFQDTNQLQWNIFKQIFTTDDDHHITIVGDPKQSIFSFQGADSAVYNIAREYIKPSGDVHDLKINYRSSNLMINAINVLAKKAEFCGYLDDAYQDSKCPKKLTDQTRPAELNGQQEIPVHILRIPAEEVIISKIIEFCTKNGDKTALQIWQKNKKDEKNGGEYRNVNFDDFAILVRDRKDANRMIEKLKKAGIPFMWHKDSTLFATKEAADWVALLSAIQAPDFNSVNRDILRQALQTEFFDVDIDGINDEKFDDILCDERQILLKWHSLAENRQYSKLINAIFEDSNISKRLASYDKIQSLSKYTQLSNFILDYLISKHGSIATAIKMLKQRKSKQTEEDNISVERATDKPTVKITTIHSAKGLEFPIVFYFMKPQADNETRFVRVRHVGEQKTILNIESKVDPHDIDFVSLRYVAITRASSLLFVINAKYRKRFAIKEPGALQREFPELFVVDESEVNQASAEELLKNMDQDVGTDVRQNCENIDLAHKRLYKHSYTSLSHHQTATDAEFNDLITEQAQRIDKDESSDSTETKPVKQYDTEFGIEIRDIYDTNNLTEVYATAERGKKYGTIIHEILERVDFGMFATDDENAYIDNLNQIIDNRCRKHSYQCSHGNIVDLIKNTMGAKFPEITGNHDTGNRFNLSSLSPQYKRAEMEFNLNPYINEELRNYFNGFIDLLFLREIGGVQVYSIVDWKTDVMDEEDYANYDKLKEYTASNYGIQRVLYSYCLIQWLRQFYPDKTPEQIFNQHFGGMYYVFVRGCNAGTCNGIYAHTWQDYERLNKAFQSIIKGIYNG